MAPIGASTRNARRQRLRPIRPHVVACSNYPITVRSGRLGLVLSSVALLALGCSTSKSASTNPCALLSRQDVANAVGGQADAGRRVQAIGETDRRLCTYHVTRATAKVGTVLVYLGRGRPPSTSGATPGGAIAAQGSVYVSVGAQYPDDSFSRVARLLADRALTRAVGP